MVKRFLVFLLVAVAIPLMGQQVDSRAQSEARPAQQTLDWGEPFFPYPDWLFKVEEQADRIEGTWTNGSLLSVVYYKRGFNFEKMTVTEIDQLVDAKWIDVVMQNYDKAANSKRCILGNYLLVELNAVHNDANYSARYWVWSDSEAFSEVFAAFPSKENQE